MVDVDDPSRWETIEHPKLEGGAGSQVGLSPTWQRLFELKRMPNWLPLSDKNAGIWAGAMRSVPWLGQALEAAGKTRTVAVETAGNKSRMVDKSTGEDLGPAGPQTQEFVNKLKEQSGTINTAEQINPYLVEGLEYGFGLALDAAGMSGFATAINLIVDFGTKLV